MSTSAGCTSRKFFPISNNITDLTNTQDVLWRSVLSTLIGFTLKHDCFSQEPTPAGQRRKLYTLISVIYRCGEVPRHPHFLDRWSMLRHLHAGLKAWDGRCLYYFSLFTTFKFVHETWIFITGTFIYHLGCIVTACSRLSPVFAQGWGAHDSEPKLCNRYHLRGVRVLHCA